MESVCRSNAELSPTSTKKKRGDYAAVGLKRTSVETLPAPVLLPVRSLDKGDHSKLGGGARGGSWTQIGTGAN